MKHSDIRTALLVSLLTGVASTITPALAGSKCDNPHGSIEQRACAKAAAGPEELRRFIWRTRAIYGLYYYDFAKDDGVSAAPTQSTQAGN